jgi:hypothetical protein
MKKASFDAIRTAFEAALIELQKGLPLPMEEHWEYVRSSADSWNGKLVLRPSFIGLHREPKFEDLRVVIEAALKEDYPEYLRLVGTPFSTGALQPSSILPSLVFEAYKRFRTFALTDEQIETILAETSDSHCQGLRQWRELRTKMEETVGGRLPFGDPPMDTRSSSEVLIDPSPIIKRGDMMALDLPDEARKRPYRLSTRRL